MNSVPISRRRVHDDREAASQSDPRLALSIDHARSAKPESLSLSFDPWPAQGRHQRAGGFVPERSAPAGRRISRRCCRTWSTSPDPMPPGDQADGAPISPGSADARRIVDYNGHKSEELGRWPTPGMVIKPYGLPPTPWSCVSCSASIAFDRLSSQRVRAAIRPCVSGGRPSQPPRCQSLTGNGGGRAREGGRIPNTRPPNRSRSPIPRSPPAASSARDNQRAKRVSWQRLHVYRLRRNRCDQSRQAIALSLRSVL